MDIADLNTAFALVSQSNQLRQALEIFSSGGNRIVSMTISNAQADTADRRVQVDTSDIPYPPQMVEAIVAALQVRLDEVNAKLSGFGLTGVPASPRAAAKPRK